MGRRTTIFSYIDLQINYIGFKYKGYIINLKILNILGIESILGK
jgi:hypothetical protein